MLTERRAKLLSLIISEYVDSAMPVGSEAIVRRFDLPFSVATIRNEMARLEDEGFITPSAHLGRAGALGQGLPVLRRGADGGARPAGATPSRRSGTSSTRPGREEDEWIQLAAAVLARAVENAAVVTVPRTPESRLKRRRAGGHPGRRGAARAGAAAGAREAAGADLPGADRAGPAHGDREPPERCVRRHSARRRSRGRRCSSRSWSGTSRTRCARSWRRPTAAATTRRTSKACATCCRSRSSRTSEKMLNLLDVLEQRNLTRAHPVPRACRRTA